MSCQSMNCKSMSCQSMNRQSMNCQSMSCLVDEMNEMKDYDLLFLSEQSSI